MKESALSIDSQNIDVIQLVPDLNSYGFNFNSPIDFIDVNGELIFVPPLVIGAAKVGGAIAVRVAARQAARQLARQAARPRPIPRPVGPVLPPFMPPEPEDEEPNCCKPCTPEAGHYYYSIELGIDRDNGAHAPTPQNPQGIDQVKYWRMNQRPYSDTDPEACQCFLNHSHSDPDTVVPMPGPKYHKGPPPAFKGPLLGGGKLR